MAITNDNYQKYGSKVHTLLLSLELKEKTFMEIYALMNDLVLDIEKQSQLSTYDKCLDILENELGTAEMLGYPFRECGTYKKLIQSIEKEKELLIK